MMKKYILEFMRRGMAFMGFGPIILAFIWLALGKAGVIASLSPDEVALGVVTVLLLAFVAAGITVVYQIESLPLLYAMLIHGAVLYLDYAVIYLVNGWLSGGIVPFVIFSVCFAAGYALVWVFIYLGIRRDVEKMNRRVK